MDNVIIYVLFIGLPVVVFGLPLALILWSKLGVSKWFQNNNNTEQEKLPDWKARIDEEERAEREKWEKERLRVWKRDFSLLLQDHQNNYRCQCFGHNLPSTGPRGFSWSQAGVQPVKDLRWDRPCNLDKCSICLRWICDAHLHKGICEECDRKSRKI